MNKLSFTHNSNIFSVYGTYDDLSLNAFMEVQLNTEFRPAWDDTALQLKVIDSHPTTNSDLLYWLVKFPVSFYEILNIQNYGTSQLRG